MHGYRYIFTVEDEHYMEICLEEAMEAEREDEVPVGAIVVAPDRGIIARTHNLTRQRKSPAAHAEMLAIEETAAVMGNYRLTGCTLYVSKEPCIMCAGAIIEARLRRLVFGCFDAKRGAFGSVIDANRLPLNHKVELQGGVLKEKSEDILKRFFQIRRGTEVAITGPTRNRLYVQ
jgi:tRNA(adenine34) deaminase